MKPFEKAFFLRDILHKFTVLGKLIKYVRYDSYSAEAVCSARAEIIDGSRVSGFPIFTAVLLKKIALQQS